MKINLTPSGTLDIETGSIFLRNAQPVLNGAVLNHCRSDVILQEGPHLIIRYTAPVLGTGAFWVEVNLADLALGAPPNCHWLRYWVEGLDPQISLNAFGLSFSTVENLRLYLQNGYYSWDGSSFVSPEPLNGLGQIDSRPETGYAMTQLLPLFGSNNTVLGFDRHDRFQHTFTFNTHQSPPSLSIQSLWDQKDRAGLERCDSERLIIFEHSEVEEALRQWAHIVAKISPTPPRISQSRITGWSSWYNLYSYVSDEVILEHLQHTEAAARREHLPLQVFQIDDGFTPEMGDWLDVKPQFPRGMKPLLADIRSAGFIPGLWIAPFMVGNRSCLFQEHPDWVVQDRLTGGPLVQWQHFGEYRWHKRSEEYYILDTTHPEAFEYLRRVFRTWRTEWGCEYFKTDFLHFGSDHGPDRAVWHTPGLTRIEIWRRVAQMIRDEIGDALWLGCGCPLWASVGLVDGIRIGHDVGVNWAGNVSAQSLLRDLATRSFANNILWQLDPDSILLREKYHSLTDAEVQSLAIYASMSGGVIMTSDAINELSPERSKLLRLILGNGKSDCQFPLMGQSALFYEPPPPTHHLNGNGPTLTPRYSDPVLVQVRTSSESNGPHETLTAVFIFNTADYPVQRTYPLSALNLKESFYAYEWITDAAQPAPVDHLRVVLSPHESALFFLSREPITERPLHLP